MDKYRPEVRSRIMSCVRSKDTKPEVLVRKLLFSSGYRYRIHCRNLPGKPDIVFPKKRKIIFVHGCFWHLHECAEFRAPKTKTDFWITKLKNNKQNDFRTEKRLKADGWNILIIWECELKNQVTLKTKLQDFLEER